MAHESHTPPVEYLCTFIRKFTVYLKPHKPSRTTEFDAQEVPNRARTHIPRPPFGELCILHTFI